MRVIIAGGRDFDDYDTLEYYCTELYEWGNRHRRRDWDHVLCGGARGADALGKRFAQEKGIDVKDYPAPWDTHGKAAGFLRNERMAENADMLIAFWDGQSKGTKHMIDLALQHGLEVHVYRYPPQIEERF
jgi:hypothetical protein